MNATDVHTDEALNLIFRALADPTRRRIIQRLADGPATVNELVAPFDLSQPTVSNHIKVLEQAGLVTRARDGQCRPATLNPEPLETAIRWIGGYCACWENNFDNLAESARELQRKLETDGGQDDEPDRP